MRYALPSTSLDHDHHDDDRGRGGYSHKHKASSGGKNTSKDTVQMQTRGPFTSSSSTSSADQQPVMATASRTRPRTNINNHRPFPLDTNIFSPSPTSSSVAITTTSPKSTQCRHYDEWYAYHLRQLQSSYDHLHLTNSNMDSIPATSPTAAATSESSGLRVPSFAEAPTEHSVGHDEEMTPSSSSDSASPPLSIPRLGTAARSDSSSSTSSSTASLLTNLSRSDSEDSAASVTSVSSCGSQDNDNTISAKPRHIQLPPRPQFSQSPPPTQQSPPPAVLSTAPDGKTKTRLINPTIRQKPIISPDSWRSLLPKSDRLYAPEPVLSYRYERWTEQQKADEKKEALKNASSRKTMPSAYTTPRAQDPAKAYGSDQWSKYCRPLPSSDAMHVPLPSSPPSWLGSDWMSLLPPDDPMVAGPDPVKEKAKQDKESLEASLEMFRKLVRQKDAEIKLGKAQCKREIPEMTEELELAKKYAEETGDWCLFTESRLQLLSWHWSDPAPPLDRPFAAVFPDGSVLPKPPKTKKSAAAAAATKGKGKAPAGKENSTAGKEKPGKYRHSADPATVPKNDPAGDDERRQMASGRHASCPAGPRHGNSKMPEGKEESQESCAESHKELHPSEPVHLQLPTADVEDKRTSVEPVEEVCCPLPRAMEGLKMNTAGESPSPGSSSAESDDAESDAESDDSFATMKCVHTSSVNEIMPKPSKDEIVRIYQVCCDVQVVMTFSEYTCRVTLPLFKQHPHGIKLAISADGRTVKLGPEGGDIAPGFHRMITFPHQSDADFKRMKTYFEGQEMVVSFLRGAFGRSGIQED
ncbi:unnamed protein product [Sympodiomycopsis kandeliae]